ncbi:DUF2812 domain-containing protein [Sporolactobacillus shoreicorticis]|uniref:DUF2812 domain-containing protein n=1 Tax=Sporolactobacillus shoreicorticis TaxID=1923877 RepID=A0ABW5S220_9BACL|nr:DUF2812 domain-containing protein [Sporolactobacillus shoreicorticis]MCO7125902.1 DUF2812 domain-containing protein [Sporolactobacillus shoreicorticis]
MNKVVYRMFWDYEREEEWLNQMAAHRWALTRYFWARYEFEPCQSGEYIYRIELLEKSKKDRKSGEYLQLLKETGIMPIAFYMNWVYLRKPADRGPFQLYTDLDSRIAHYRRIKNMWYAIILAELAAAGINFYIGLTDLLYETRLSGWINFAVGVLLLIGGGMLFLYNRRLERKIKQLEDEHLVHE